MLRALFFAIFVLFVGQVTGATAALAASEPCGESCPDDGPEERCAPSCTHCACGVQLAIALPGPRLVSTASPPAQRPDDRVPAFTANAPPSPDPREILRVPR
jgi:hypothetical protein